MMCNRLARFVVIGVAVVLVATACGGEISNDDSATQDTETQSDTEPEGSSVDEGASDQESPDPDNGGTPDGLPLVEGLAPLDVLGPPVSGAGTVPLFSWQPVDGTDVYQLVVLGPGGPIWGWRGVESEIRLGGLPFERPAGMTGPVIGIDTCWSVIALDAAGHVVAASEFLPVSPFESDEHICVPGLGAEQPT